MNANFSANQHYTDWCEVTSWMSHRSKLQTKRLKNVSRAFVQGCSQHSNSDKYFATLMSSQFFVNSRWIERFAGHSDTNLTKRWNETVAYAKVKMFAFSFHRLSRMSPFSLIFPPLEILNDVNWLFAHRIWQWGINELLSNFWHPQINLYGRDSMFTSN